MAETRQVIMFLLLLSYLNVFTHAKVICTSSAYTPSEESETCLQYVYTGTIQNTWSEARSLCQADGGDLVKIVNQAMNDLILGMCTANSDFMSQSTSVQRLWIGLNDREDEETWVWLDETTPVSWTNWFTNQPGGGTSQNCAVLDAYASGEWRDIECSDDVYWDMNSYVCEFPALSIITVSCPGDYVPSEESWSCVKLFVNLGRGYSWYDARDECGLDGGDLVKIVNQGMNDLIYDMAMSDSDFNEQINLWTWIGLNNKFGYTWVWLDEENQAAWTNWIYGQPEINDQDCAVLDTSYLGKWRDIECESGWPEESYLCEIPALTTTIATTTTTKPTSTAVTNVTTPKIFTTLAITPTTSPYPVVTRETSSGGLSIGAIAGIVTGVLVFAALVPAAFLTIRFFRNRHLHTDHSVAYTNGRDDREAIVTVG